MSTTEGPPPAAEPDRRPSLLRSSALTYGSMIAASVLSLLNVLVMARVLGPTGRGDVVFLTAMALLSSWIASLGIEQANVNLAGRDRSLVRPLAGNSLLLAAVFGVVAIGVVALMIVIEPSVAGESDTALRWVMLATIPMLIALVFLRQLAIAFYGFGVMSVAHVVPSVLNLAVNGILALAGVLTVTTAILAWIAGQAIATLIAGWYVMRKLDGFGRPDRALAARSLRFGLKAHVAQVMLIGNYRVDQWILGAIAGSRELGLYSIAVAWSEGLFFLPNALAAVQRPDMVRSDERGAAKQGSAIFRITMLATLVAALIMALAAPFLCTTIFGEEFAGSVDDLRILAFGAFGIGALKLLGNALVAQGKPLLQTIAAGVSFVVIIGLDILLIPNHGGSGAAVASTVAYSAGGIAVVILFARALGAHWTDLVPRPSDVTFLLGRIRGALRRG